MMKIETEKQNLDEVHSPLPIPRFVCCTKIAKKLTTNGSKSPQYGDMMRPCTVASDLYDRTVIIRQGGYGERFLSNSRLDPNA